MAKCDTVDFTLDLSHEAEKQLTQLTFTWSILYGRASWALDNLTATTVFLHFHKEAVCQSGTWFPLQLFTCSRCLEKGLYRPQDGYVSPEDFAVLM